MAKIVRCSIGKIQVVNGVLEIVQVFNRTALSVPVRSIIGFIVAPSTGVTDDMVMHTKQGIHELKMVLNFQSLRDQLPGVPVEYTSTPWYRSQILRAYVGVYTDPTKMQNEIAQALQNGWQIQGQSAIAGHVNVAGIIAGDILAGPLGALIASGRSKDKTTLTFVRSPEWLAAHQQP